MKIIRYIVLSMAVLTVLIVLTGISLRKAGIYKVEKYTREITDHIVKSLDEEALIGQLFMFLYPLDDLESISLMKPGGIFIYGGNIPSDKNNNQDIARLDSQIEIINNMYLEKDLPLPWFSIDQEGGRVRRIQTADTDFPSAMTFGEAYTKTGKNDLPMLAAFHTCIQLRKHGIQWPLTPVADVQANPDNPVIGERSYGSDPEVVYQMVSGYIMGLQNARCMSSIKHFPGHGDTNLDSHRDLPEIHKNLNDLELTDLYPYKKSFGDKESPRGLMSAHIIFREIDDKPATLSRKWLTEKLRTEYGFQGVIVTDDLAMNAMNIFREKAGIRDVAVESFNAGADILLYVMQGKESRGMLENFKTAVKNGEVSRQRIDESARRIISEKIKLGILDGYLRKQMPSWPEDIQRKAALLLKYSGELNENVKLLETRLATADSVNKFVSREGIRTIWGDDKPDEKIHSYPVFTDLHKESAGYLRVKEKAASVYPLASLGEFSLSDKCVVLQTQKSTIADIPAGQRKMPCVIYTINDPFPKKKVVPSLRQGDVVITTFSPTRMSAEKLVEIYLEGIIPQRTSIIY